MTEGHRIKKPRTTKKESGAIINYNKLIII